MDMAQTQTATTKRASRFTADADAIYLTDNGASRCGSHLGVTAQFSGRDISGQRILRLCATDAAWWQQHNDAGNLPMCETCKKVWTA